MKHRYMIITLLAAVTTLAGCAARETIQARAMLAKCGFELESIDLQLIKFAPVISFNNGTKKFSVDEPSVVELLPLLMDLKARKFSIDIENLDFTADMKIHNPNIQEAILDRMQVDAYLDDMLLARITHQDYEAIPAMGETVVPLQIRVPVTVALQKTLDAQEIILKGKVWLKLNVVGKLGVVIPFPISIKRPVPRDKIKKAVKKEQGRIVRKLVKELESEQTMEKAGKALRGLFE